ncbi:GyrI-like domain-containing protein [Ruminococcaceae bacterium OttesenSCG-928-A16]|nr:GyrI-like domain-containing protein [Ruminococcaceae bacterium OttesenSCG-928-A16]
MEYKIEKWPAFKVAGFKHRMQTKQAFNVVPGIWEAAWKDGKINQLMQLLQSTNYRPAGFLGIAITGQQGQANSMDYLLGATTYVDVENGKHLPAPGGMDEIEIKAATWVVVQANGKLPGAVQNVYPQFYSEWLPASGYQLEDLPVIECYMQENRQEVWFAVTEKA